MARSRKSSLFLTVRIQHGKMNNNNNKNNNNKEKKQTKAFAKE
jgi:hypothetical protein